MRLSAFFAVCRRAFSTCVLRKPVNCFHFVAPSTVNLSPTSHHKKPLLPLLNRAEQPKIPLTLHVSLDIKPCSHIFFLAHPHSPSTPKTPVNYNQHFLPSYSCFYLFVSTSFLCL
ncbi:hypothetical protein BDZ91DRAFT_720768 [Kalaharituber pfeilii]|nr:hypothetical protein BDZ91DRAFT_720768 [Kalaharituber pfeilii]